MVLLAQVSPGSVFRVARREGSRSRDCTPVPYKRPSDPLRLRAEPPRSASRLWLDIEGETPRFRADEYPASRAP
jgi:hypothetical protein